MQQYLSGEALIFSAKKDNSFEYEFILPEYLPNISKIIKSSAWVEKCTFRQDTGSSFADTDICIRIIYVSDFGSKIKSALFRETVSIPLSDVQDNNSDASFFTSACVSNLIAKPVSPRKVSVSAICHASVVGKTKSALPFFDAKDDDKICVLEKQLQICTKTTLSEQRAEYGADITLDASKPAVKDIICADAYFCSSSCKAMEASLEYEAVFKILALYEVYDENENAENTEYAFISSDVTVNGIIENYSVNENCVGSIYFDVCSVEPSVSFDAYGDNRVLSFTLKYNACPVIYEMSDVTLALDAFAENRISAPVYSSVSVDSLYKRISDTVRVSEPVRADIRDIAEISACKPSVLSVSTERTDGKFFALIKCALEVFGTNTLGELTAFDSTVNLHVPVSSGETFPDNAVSDIILSIKNCNASVKEGELLCDFEIDMSGIIALSKAYTAVTDINIDSSSETISDNGRIIIYYPCKNDSLWSVAKKYTVKPDTIAEANAIENSDISSKHILIIP
ncbi:MAG: LysM peptidoglycan-binding domain-containing protein [Ruminococcaceae bacterium]|nr:LysM peptidoglycan-binding domain-containing protein [Oscillospiraceae bacterium]